ncbi:MAG: ABC transporter ATP-binding protein, partial [Chloroflexota bacterium]
MADIWRAVTYLRAQWRTTLGAFMSLIFVSSLTLVSPWIIQIIIDQGIEAQSLTVVWIASLVLLGVALVRNLFTFTQTFWIEKASQGVAFDARNDLFTKLSRLSFSYHDQSQTGQLMTRATSDVDTMRTFIGNGLLQIVNALILLIGSATILLVTNWQLGLMVLMVIPAIAVVFVRFFLTVGPRFRVVAQKLGNLNTVLQENLAGIRVVKAFAREPYEHQRFRGANDDLLQETLAVVRGAASSFPLVFFIANVGTLVVIWAGGLQVINQTLSIGELVAFNTYLTYLLMPIFILGGTLASIPQA